VIRSHIAEVPRGSDLSHWFSLGWVPDDERPLTAWLIPLCWRRAEPPISGPRGWRRAEVKQ
jgi:hypothetical protein